MTQREKILFLFYTQNGYYFVTNSFVFTFVVEKIIKT